MKLIIDIGNTNSVYAILNDNNYIYKRRLSPNENLENITNFTLILANEFICTIPTDL